jgi:hypothetical protein
VGHPHVEQLRAKASPEAEFYRHADVQMRQLRDDLRRHELKDVVDRYRADCIPLLQQRLDAVVTWWRWAWGTASTRVHSPTPSTH